MSEQLALKTAKDINLDDNSDVKSNDLVLQEKSKHLVEELFSVEIKDLKAQQQKASAIRELGLGTQRKLTQRSKLLQQPLTKLVNDAEDGSEVGNALIVLQEQTDKINPGKIDFSMGTVRRLLAKIPAIGTPLSRWFAKYQSVEGVIQGIVKSLEDGKRQLERDNRTLKDDQIVMRELIFELKDYVALGAMLDQDLASKLESSKNIDPARKEFLEEEILFPLRQRILDLQQQLAVNQQGVLTSEVIIRNNRELIRGVSRALNVTVSALNVAASLAVALQTQKTILNSVTAVNETTDKLIADTAKNLREQGADIHKKAASAQINIDSLKAAFVDVSVALDEISKFRRDALPEMSKSISEMSQITADMDIKLQKLDARHDLGEEILIK
ncbi:MAG: toxic anion resistance protein [Cellvibrionaceae bacterium]